MAASLLFLMGMTALAVDGGRLYSERRSAQNAADHAAVAAAFAECTGATEEEARTAGLDAAAANGFDNDGTTNTVQVTREAEYRYRSTVDSNISGTFSRVLGADQLATGATAVASCTPGVIQGEALFANGSGCDDPELLIKGNNITVDGDAHSNEDVLIDGNGLEISGTLGHVGDVEDNQEETNNYNSVNASPASYPIDFQIADYQPSGSVASAAGAQYFDVANESTAGSWDTSTSTWTVPDGAILEPGIYYSPGAIEVGNNVDVEGASGGEIDGVTFVAEGKITFKDSAEFTAWGGPSNQDLVVFSNHPGTPSCDEVAVEMNGNTNEFHGIVLAKYGVVSVRGNSESTFGGVWGHRVEVHANSLAVTGPLIGSGGDPEVTFDE